MTKEARIILCAALLAYLAGDLFLFNGPLHRSLQSFNPDSPVSIEKARKKGLIARVGEHAISASQLERATAESLWAQGKNFSTLSAADQKAARQLALAGLIDQQLLAAKIDPKQEIPKAELDERYQRFTALFDSKEALAAALKSQGISSEAEIRQRFALRLREEKFVSAQTAAASRVSEDDAKKWFAANEKSLALPERVEVRHIFIATLETPQDQAKQKLDGVLAALTAKQKDFAALAKELSEDPASKDNGGDLGWMTRQRLAPDFAEPVFSLPVGQPSLIRTKLGWHLIEVTARKAAEARSFDDAKPEIIAAIEAAKRRDAVAAFREKLRNDSAAEVRIYDPELLP